MQSRLKPNAKHSTAHFLRICCAIFVSIGFIGSRAEVNDYDLPQGWESYLDRPDIQDVPARAHDLGKAWAALKDAHFSFIAELLVFYPADTHFYFLARDGETLYDVARLVTQGTTDAQRVHLINVSRANIRDENLKAYLEVNGISEESLAAGKKVLFIEPGVNGTIPLVIGHGFPHELRVKLKTHLIVSNNPSHPSSRAFLIHLNPRANGQNPSAMQGTIKSYEHMARYTDRSERFVFSGGRYHPLSLIGRSVDGVVSKKQSLRIMEDVKADWLTLERQTLFHGERKRLEKVKRLLTKATGRAELKRELEKEQGTAKGRLLEAWIRDALEMRTNAGLKINVSLDDLGLRLPNSEIPLERHAKRNEMIAAFPEWSQVLENPESGIPELFKQKNWQMIKSLIDANIDSEINVLLAKSLFDAPGVGIKRSLQRLMIEKGEVEVTRDLAVRYFSLPDAKNMVGLIELVIRQRDVVTLANLARYAFSQESAKDMEELIRLLIQEGGLQAWRDLAKYTFSQAHTEGMGDLIRLLIEKAVEVGEMQTLRNLAEFTFSQTHTKGMGTLIRLLIENGDAETLQRLAKYAFSRAHINTKEMKGLIKLLIEKAVETGDMRTLRYLAQYTFSQEHTEEMGDLIKLLIEKGDAGVRRDLAQFRFSQAFTEGAEPLIRRLVELGDTTVWRSLIASAFSGEHTKGMIGTLKYLCELADEATLRYLDLYVFPRPHAQTLEYRLLQESLNTRNPVQKYRCVDLFSLR